MYKKELGTASGMWGLWNYDTYKHIDDYDKWDRLFCEDEDIVKQIESQYFVPIYIFEDGCRSFTIRIDEEISEREKKYICVQSEGYYSVQTYLIAWDEEPGAFLNDGEISANALSDFVVIIKSDANRNREYRTKINTFSEDD